jgi:hypothetical protein
MAQGFRFYPIFERTPYDPPLAEPYVEFDNPTDAQNFIGWWYSRN